MMDLVADIALLVVFAAFVSGLLLTATTGSARPVKIFLGILTAIFSAASIAGLMFTGLLIYLLFQIIAAILILYLVIILGAVCGWGLYVLRHKKPRGKPLSKFDIAEYLPLAEFATVEGITEERALARIQSSYYRGGLHEGAWYIHKAELSSAKKPVVFDP
jgi:hypothetical protein